MDLEKSEIIQMLGKVVKITNIVKNNDIYYGIFNFKDKEHKAYIIIKNNIEDDFEGKIVGIIKIKNTDEIRVVVSEKNSKLCYAEIKGYLLGREKDLDNAKFKCLNEKSAGVIVYKIIDNNPYFLVVYSKKNYPGFPKGHVEYGEKDEEAAVRELKEETGLSLEIESDFKESIFYQVDETPIQKQVVFFLGKKIENEEIKIDETELTMYEIMSYEKAREVLNQNMENILTSAKDYIERKYLK